MIAVPDQRGFSPALLGRSFVHGAFDYLLIGGGLSLIVAAWVFFNQTSEDRLIFGTETLTYFILFSNSAHFAASTVRLYTKPNSRESLPFLTMAFPLVMFVLLTVCIWQADRLGPHLLALYLTWSPYHYAAQAYGLAVVYCYRSGCALSPGDKRLLWWVCQIPFFYILLYGKEGGLRYLSDYVSIESGPMFGALGRFETAVRIIALAAPLLLYFKVWKANSGPMPLISLLVIITNGVWWFVLSPLNAFVWATVFHGVQYLAIVVIFHVKDQTARPENRHGALFHSVMFYAASLALGYGLFQCLPLGFVFAGFGLLESVLLVTAAINIHHFVVDAYVWRLKKGDSNRRIVDRAELAA